jgi:hypothetical protein
VRRRLVISVAFALIGLLGGVPVSDKLGYSLAASLAGCALASGVLGYVTGKFLDVFSASADDGETDSVN